MNQFLKSTINFSWTSWTRVGMFERNEIFRLFRFSRTLVHVRPRAVYSKIHNFISYNFCSIRSPEIFLNFWLNGTRPRRFPDLKGPCYGDFVVFWSKLLRRLTKKVFANMTLLSEHREENIKGFLQGTTNYN